MSKKNVILQSQLPPATNIKHEASLYLLNIHTENNIMILFVIVLWCDEHFAHWCTVYGVQSMQNLINLCIIH